ncbi:MAG: glutamine-hydrolyzing carbamoyl-phosphate synthase small subunit [Candidatus Verstraetearchaeota archaeon]|nr:glutamine-hydrolyzing carbamoyl-phosphate synthase small subunit [Candidatus Verstraetearchaeota archaeon]
MLNREKGVLVLEDGSVFYGRPFGARKKVFGEVVFSTSMVGYPESLTDPSYRGQILTLTYPIVGNYGVPSCEAGQIPDCFESDGIKAEGLIVHDLCDEPSHWTSGRTLDQWLKDEGIPGLYGIDTRKLTKRLRERGVMKGVLQALGKGEEPDVEGLFDELARSRIEERNLVEEVSIRRPLVYEGRGPTVVLIDCGVKLNIVRNLVRRGIRLVRVPFSATIEEVLSYDPSGVFLSNGPGDPKRCVETIKCMEGLLETDIPIMGICLGNQILALASGGETYKLKYGHRAQNQPVIDLKGGRGYITTQNHGYAIEEDSIQNTPFRASYVNANDKTIEGIAHQEKEIFAVQWHPEASPGPFDTEFLFDRFVESVRRHSNA